MIDDIEKKLDIGRYTTIVLGVALAFFVFRSWLATQSGFSFHQGWNEGHYALIGHGFLRHPLVPKYGTHYVYNVPPLFPYTVAASFVAFGETVFAARLPSIVAATLTIPVTYALGVEVYDSRRTAALGASLLAVLPYFQLYGGRAQTDVMMLLFFTGSLVYIVRGYTSDSGATRQLVIGGTFFALAFAAKQPAVILPAIVLVWLLVNRQFDVATIRKTGVLIAASAASLVPLIVWFYLNYQLAPAAFVNAWEHELLQRTAPFANLKLLFAIGFGLGIGPVVLTTLGVEVIVSLRSLAERAYTGWEEIDGPSILAWWVVLYGLFVLYRTPHGHQYYAVALTPPIALLAARGVERVSETDPPINRYDTSTVKRLLVAVLLLTSMVGTTVLFELSGEYSISNGGGERVAQHAGTYLAEEVSENATVLVASGYRPPIQWYTRSTDADSVTSYRLEQFPTERIAHIQNETEGPVYVVYVSPTWTATPPVLRNKSYTTRSYEFTIMNGLDTYVETDSKFTYYLEARRIVVYRIA